MCIYPLNVNKSSTEMYYVSIMYCIMLSVYTNELSLNMRFSQEIAYELLKFFPVKKMSYHSVTLLKKKKRKKIYVDVTFRNAFEANP